MEQSVSSVTNWSPTILGTQFQNTYIEDSNHYIDIGTTLSESEMVPLSFKTSHHQESSVPPRESQNIINNNATLENNLVYNVEENNENCSVDIEGEWFKLC